MRSKMKTGIIGMTALMVLLHVATTSPASAATQQNTTALTPVMAPFVDVAPFNIDGVRLGMNEAEAFAAIKEHYGANVTITKTTRPHKLENGKTMTDMAIVQQGAYTFRVRFVENVTPEERFWSKFVVFTPLDDYEDILRIHRSAGAAIVGSVTLYNKDATDAEIKEFQEAVVKKYGHRTLDSSQSRFAYSEGGSLEYCPHIPKGLSGCPLNVPSLRFFPRGTDSFTAGTLILDIGQDYWDQIDKMAFEKAQNTSRGKPSL